MKSADKINLIVRNKLSNQLISEAFTIHQYKVTSISGDTIDLNTYAGKYMLLVNVASKCGFTKQYKALQKLSDTYPESLVIIGFPCNQFGGQEPGNEDQILDFCEMRFGVTFPLTEKIMVKGVHQHPIYQWLTRKSLNGKKNSSVHWNFQKYLIDPKGNLVDVFYSITSPLSKRITRHLRD